MIEIIAHRGCVNGSDNIIKNFPYFVENEIGVELDLRLGKNGPYVSHDKTENGKPFEEICKTYRNSKVKFAFHIKEQDSINQVIEIVKKYSIENYFVFNTDNFELSNFVGAEKNALYLNQKPIFSNEKFLWCDESQRKWFTKDIFLELHKKNKIIYGMSLELIKTCNEEDIIMEWKRLIDLGIDGICTNYPEKLTRYLKGDLY